MSRALVGLVVVLMSLPSGAAAATTPEPVRHFAEIQVGAVSVQLDPTGTGATVEVSTSIDAACAVVFGEDETFGRIATDMDMAGGAHRDHRVTLGALAPDTAYVFRLQGSAADGNLYRSETISFRTPAATATATDNLALGSSIVEVSSEFSRTYAARNAIDGDLSTEWSSLGDGDDAFITLDLGTSVDVAAVAFRTRQMSDGSATTRTFTVIADGETFGPFPAGGERAHVEVRAQVLRFEVASSTGGNTGAVEIEIYGSGSP